MLQLNARKPERKQNKAVNVEDHDLKEYVDFRQTF